MTTLRWIHDCGFFKIVDLTHISTARSVQDAWTHQRNVASHIRDTYEDVMEDRYRQQTFPRLFPRPPEDEHADDVAISSHPQLPPRLTTADVPCLRRSRGFSFSSLCAYPEVHKKPT